VEEYLKGFVLLEHCKAIKPLINVVRSENFKNNEFN